MTVRVARSTTVVSSAVEDRTRRCSVEPPAVGTRSVRRAERRRSRDGSVVTVGARAAARASSVASSLVVGVGCSVTALASGGRCRGVVTVMADLGRRRR